MKKRKGITLIEIIVSIAVIGVLVIPIFTIFNSGLMNILRAGTRTEVVIDVKENMDALLLGNTPGTEFDHSATGLVENIVNVGFDGTGIVYNIPSGKMKKYIITNIYNTGKDIWVTLVTYNPT